ncbi:MAG TPA: adenylosuccinate synthase [Gemmatimonadales bacterium]|jgi:adenylosuccinate synthase|nr:adenylosuccinate synthase [Gemmatimonadales bacterium]
MFDRKHNCLVVVGAQWGDEGKGKLVDVLAEQADVVVRYQGGANAGHTVVVGDRQFVLHQIPSGILHPGAVCVVGNGVVLDPETFFAEIDALAERGIEIGGRLFVSDRAHVVLPYHKLLDNASEKQQQIGTTGRGIGPAYEDKTGRRGVRVADLVRGEGAAELLTPRIERANALLAMMGSSARVSLDEHLELVARLGARLRPLTCDTGLLVHQALRASRRVLLEGAQGALLDVDHGTYPFVTSSSTTAGGASIGAGIGPTEIDGVLGVVKAYTTRVGNGPLPTEAHGELEHRLRELGSEFGATTGRPRRCGWFDATVVRYSVRVNGLTGLAVTKLDVLDTFAEIPVGVAYRLGGGECAEMPSDVEYLDRVEPVYETLPGWRQPTENARKLADLPPLARAYLDRLQDLAGAPIRYVSVGTRRDQIIEVQ